MSCMVCTFDTRFLYSGLSIQNIPIVNSTRCTGYMSFVVFNYLYQIQIQMRPLHKELHSTVYFIERDAGPTQTNQMQT